MAALQIKNVPPELHRRLRQRAAEEGRSVSSYALEVLRRDVERMTNDQWFALLARDRPGSGITTDDVLNEIREGRAERESQLARRRHRR